MPRVTFVETFHFKPTPNLWQTIEPGARTVTTACAAAARAAGKLAPEPVKAAPDPPAEPQPEGQDT